MKAGWSLGLCGAATVWVLTAPVPAHGAGAEFVDLRLHDSDALSEGLPPRCLVQQHCLASESPRTAQSPPVDQMPRMSLPLGSYGPATFNFNGSRVRVKVAF